MAWCALVRTWNQEHKVYESLTLRIDDTPEPGCLVRLYSGEAIVAESLGDSPQSAMTKALELARAYLKDASITEESLRWVQVR